jgi:hypothetical protein
MTLIDEVGLLAWRRSRGLLTCGAFIGFMPADSTNKCYVFDVARARGSHQRSSRARARGVTNQPAPRLDGTIA